MKQFEYLELDISKPFFEKSPLGNFCKTRDEKLTELGKEGWEAVGGYGINNSTFLFKREIESDTRERSREARPRRRENEYSYSD
jgi:hypothetical protein